MKVLVGCLCMLGLTAVTFAQEPEPAESCEQRLKALSIYARNLRQSRDQLEINWATLAARLPQTEMPLSPSEVPPGKTPPPSRVKPKEPSPTGEQP